MYRIVLLAAMAWPGVAAFSLRIGSGETDLARYKEYGYNAAVLGSFTQLAMFDEGTVSASLRARIEAERARFREQAAVARR